MKLATGKKGPTPLSHAGFTLLELLVVISIIGILAALTAGAAFRLIDSRKESNTKELIRRVDKLMLQQWQAAIDDANTHLNEMPPGIVTMAGGDYERAKVIWRKLWLKREFPMSYADILQPIGPNVYNITMPPRAAYVAALQNLKAPPAPPPLPTSPPPGPSPVASGPGPGLTPPTLPPQAGGSGPNPQAMNPPSPSWPAGGPNWPQANQWSPNSPAASSQAGACLLLALSVGRRGNTVDADTFSTLAVADTDEDGLKEIVDAWGTPLAFYRGSTGYFPLAKSTPAYDPLDPDSRLMDPTWNNPNNPAIAVFEQWFHPIHAMVNGQWVPTPFYYAPVIVSCGPDQKLGLLPVQFPLAPGQYLMMPDGTGGDNDNIYNLDLK